MGFEIGGNTARLEFAEGTSLAGATVRVSLDMPIRDALALQRMGNHLSAISADSSEAVDLATETYRKFGDDVLLSWDLETGGQPIPANGEGMLSLPLRAALDVFTAWASAVGGLPGNSLAVSVNGSPSPVALVGTAAS